MSIDASIIGYIIKYNDILKVQQAGISLEYFVDEWQSVYRYILRVRREHDTLPSADTLVARFPDIELPRVRKTEFPLLVHQMRQRRKFISFLTALEQAAKTTNDYEQVDGVIQELQGQLNSISYNSRHTNHLVDLFSPEISKRLTKEVKIRRSGQIAGIPSGFHRFDVLAGGLQKQKMVTIIGRSGLGKSWIDLFFVAKAVQSGAKVMLYPLEMTLFETAARLYTIFSSTMLGADRALKNYDLTTGKVTNAKLVRFLNLMEDKFAGQLYVADVGNLSDPYTNERIEAEVEAHNPDMFWVDYLTLLKAPTGSKREEGHELVRKLSNGIKNTAMRRDVVGGCSAQVNRESIKMGVKLPRLEHISYGDSIGQDSDQVFSIARRGEDLIYALVKNRGGPEIGPTRVRFQVNSGVIHEYENQDSEDGD